MNFPYFTGKRTEPAADGHKHLPTSRRAEQNLPENYDTEKALVDAVNVALLMGQPLLLTGEPGTGKTQLAYRIAWELGFDEPLKFETKSNSTAKDLFYYYDALARFHAAQAAGQNGKATGKAVDYITYNALGLALLRANEQAKIKQLVPDDFEHCGPRRSMVLIDEIDKAPRDFPNDILNEIESFYFRIPELRNALVQADPEKQPIIIITSNSEKHLPDAFLRRCAFYHIEFPEAQRLQEIIANRLKDIKARTGKEKQHSENFLPDAIELFFELREQQHGLKKKPATAELMVWIDALREISSADNPILDDTGNVMGTLGLLLKAREDIKIAREVVQTWRPQRLQ